MLFVKRFFTALALFPALTLVLFFVAMMACFLTVGPSALKSPQKPTATDSRSGHQAGYVAGQTNYGKVILFGASSVSLVGSVLLPFMGVISWCRKPTGSPPLD